MKREPKLIEEGAVWKDGWLAERTFRWTGENSWPSSVRDWPIAAGLRPDSVRLHRDDEGLDLGRQEMSALVDACRHWLGCRNELAAFVYCEAGSFAAKASWWSYQPPGEGAEFVSERPTYRALSGEDVKHAEDPILSVAPGIELVSRMVLRIARSGSARNVETNSLHQWSGYEVPVWIRTRWGQVVQSVTVKWKIVDRRWECSSPKLSLRRLKVRALADSSRIEKNCSEVRSHPSLPRPWARL